MRNLSFFIYAVLLSACSCLLGGCEFETSENGDLDGYWYLTDVDSLENGKKVEYRKERVFWGVQNKLIMIYKFRETVLQNYDRYLLRFEYQGDRMRVHSPYMYNRKDGTEGDLPVAGDSIKYLLPLGINSLDETFKVESLNNDKMILYGSKLRLYFEKY